MSTVNDNTSANYSSAAQNMAEAVARKDIDGIRQAAKRMLECARALKLPYLEISVFSTAARAYISMGQFSNAMKLYDEASKIAKEQETSETNSDLYKLLSAQILLYRGASLLEQKPPQYNTLIENYQQAVDKITLLIAEAGQSEATDWSNSNILHFYLYEALRMMGYCYEQLGRHQAALPYYVKAVSAAEKMGGDMLRSTAIPIVGKTLLSLCRKLGMKKEYFVVIDKMNILLGDDWDRRRKFNL